MDTKSEGFAVAVASYPNSGIRWVARHCRIALQYPRNEFFALPLREAPSCLWAVGQK